MRFRLSAKLITIFTALALIPFLIIGIYAYMRADSELEKDARDQLVSIRDLQKGTMQRYPGRCGRERGFYPVQEKRPWHKSYDGCL